MFDMWLLNNELDKKVTGFKFFNVFGPNEYHKGDMRSLPAKVFDRINRGEPLRLFKSYKKEYADGEQKRDFLYVKDAIEMTLHLAETEKAGGLFNIGSGCEPLRRGYLSAPSRDGTVLTMRSAPPVAVPPMR